MVNSKIHIVILGPPAIGKLTIGKSLSDSINFPVFDNTKTVDLALIAHTYGTPEFRRFRDKLRFIFYNEILKNTCVKGLISTNVLRHPSNWRYFSQIEDIFKKYQWKTKYILLTAPVDVLLKRVEQPSRKNKSSLHTKNDLLQWLSANTLHSSDVNNKCIPIDTSRLNVQEVVNKIISFL